MRPDPIKRARELYTKLVTLDGGFDHLAGAYLLRALADETPPCWTADDLRALADVWDPS